MQTYELLVRSRSIEANGDDTTLVRTSVGVDSIHAQFDNAEWLGFPVTVTFGNGDVTVTQSVQMSSVTGSDEWYAQCTAPVPHEVLRKSGPLRVTFQGTDQSGNHIITAKGAPLMVEEAGDVTLGDVPEDAPTIDQWQQAYAQAVAAANNAASLVASLQQQLADMISTAESSISGASDSAVAQIQSLVDNGYVTATTDRLGVVQVGGGLSISQLGVLSCDVEPGGMTDAEKKRLTNLASLMMHTYDVDVDGNLSNISNLTAKPDILPPATHARIGGVIPDGITIKADSSGVIAAYGAKADLAPATTSELGGVKPDGTTITVDNDGTIHGASTYQLPVATTSTLGIVMPDNSTITIEDGVLHGATTYELPRATTMSLGGVIPDGDTITVDPDGTIHGHGGGMDFDGYRYGYITSSAYYSRKAYIFGNETGGAYTFANMSAIPSSAFRGVASIRTVNFPVAQTMGSYAFSGCTSLRSASFPKLTGVGGYAFSYCTSLEAVSLPACTRVEYEAFWNCYYLSEISLPSCSYIGQWAFENCSRLARVDLTGVSSVPMLASANAFNGTPISEFTAYTGGYGSIYVPSSLYSMFRTANRWSYYSARMVSA